jgi:hypothetical protein
LVRSRLESRLAIGEAYGLRVHRLVIQWIRSEDVEPLSAVGDALAAWAAQPEIDEELKTGGRRKLALIRAYDFASERTALGHLSGDALALIQGVYIDPSTVFGSDIVAVERQVRRLAKEDNDLDALHASVLGQISDALRTDTAKAKPALAETRTRALELLRAHVEGLAGKATVSLLDTIAEHHWGKYLLHVDDGSKRDDGLAVLERAEAHETAGIHASKGADRARFLARRTKTVIQMCDRKSPIASERAIELLLAEVSNAELAPYLRLVAARQLLAHSAGLALDTVIGTVRLGLTLVDATPHEDIAALFLAQAAKNHREFACDEVATDVESALEKWLTRYLSGRDFSRRSGIEIAFANHKLAEGQADASAFARLGRALLLAERAMDPTDDFHRQRVLAMLRDSGEFEAASALAAHEAKRDWYFSQFETAKAWRWSGALDAEAQLLDKMQADKKNGRHLTAINDERAKLFAKRGDVEDAYRLLDANALAYERKGDKAYADQCRRWAAKLRAGETRAPDAILHDEWRSQMRRDATIAEEQALARAVAERVSHAVLASIGKR